jgi:hypothetical protein
VDDERAPWAEDVETHRVIGGRRWRVSDPRIPEALRQALVDELMSARRAVRDSRDAADERAARDRVHDAKVALGERGVRWWAAVPEPAGTTDRIRRTADALVRTGRDGAGLPALVAAVTSSPPDTVGQVLGER